MMYYNPQLERWANTLPIPIPDYARRLPGGENASLMPYKNLDSESGGVVGVPTGKLYTEERSPGFALFMNLDKHTIVVTKTII